MTSNFSLKQLHSQPTTIMINWLPQLEQVLASQRIFEPADAALLINPKTQKLLSFWGYELIEKSKSKSSLNERLEVLSNFFFDQLGFRLNSTSQNISDQRTSLLLSSVVSQRSGPVHLIGLVYCYLAEQIGIKAGWVSLDKPLLLKTVLNNESRFVDLEKNCLSLANQQVVEFASEAASEGLQFSLVDARQYCDFYLKQLLTRLLVTQQVRRCVTLLNFLILMEPSNLYFLKRRAFLLYDIGEYLKAIEDIKTYRFHSSVEFLPMDLSQLNQKLNAALERETVTSLH